MKTRILETEIDHCSDCPKYDAFWGSTMVYCNLAKREMSLHNEIPDSCPLPVKEDDDE